MRLQKKFLLSSKLQRRLGINLNLYFYRFIRLKRNIINIRIIFQKGRLYFSKILFVFLFNFHVSSHNSKLIYYRLKVFCEIELIIRSKKGKIHIFTKTLKTMKNPKASTPVKSCNIKKATIIKPSKYHLLVYLKNGIPFLLFGR